MSQYAEKYTLKDLIIISGMAKGADQLGYKWAKQFNVPIISKPANWQLGKSAGFIRNKEMAAECDALIAFWDSKSSGTKHIIQTCKDLGKKVKVVFY